VSEVADSEKEAEAVDEVGDIEIAEGGDTDTSGSEVAPVDGHEVDSDGMVDLADEIEPVVNGCGGDGVLTPGEPGADCGPCLDGEFVCVANDPNLNTTVCENATTLNVCGGCGKLAHDLEAPCNDRRWSEVVVVGGQK